MPKMKTDDKPPLAKSPTRLRPRRILRSNSSSSQAPPGSLAKSQKPNRSWHMEEPDALPEYRSISSDLHALAKMVHDELGNGDVSKSVIGKKPSANSSSLFERGRFYDEYSARRNEMLKRKKGDMGGCEGKATATPYHLGVTVDLSKRRDSKKLENLRKSVSAAYSVERSENPRYLLRSMSKENRKPPLAVSNGNFEKSVLPSERKTGARRVRKI